MARHAHSIRHLENHAPALQPESVTTEARSRRVGGDVTFVEQQRRGTQEAIGRILVVRELPAAFR